MSRRLLLLVGLAWLTACAGPLSAFDPDVEAAAARRQARARLADPGTRVEAHRTLAWLCLLHDEDCAEVVAHGQGGLTATAPDERLLALLLRAIASQGELDVAGRSRAWLELLAESAQAAGRPGPDQAAGDALATVAAEALARLAVRDRAAVLAPLADAPTAVAKALATGAAGHRLRRSQALGPLVAALGPRFDPGQPLQGPPRGQLELAVLSRPVSRRLFTGLDALPATAPLAWDLALQATATEARPHVVPLPLAADQGALPPGLRTGRYHVPAREAGAYVLRARFDAGAGGRHLLVLGAPRGVRAWLDGRALPAVVTRQGLRAVLELSPGPHTLDVAVALAGNGELVTLDLVAGVAGPGADDLPATWPAAARDVVAALLEPTGPARARLARAFPRGPVAALLALEAAPATATHERSAATVVLDRVLDSFPRHADARIDRAARAREAGHPHLGLQMIADLAAEPPQLQIEKAETRTDRTPAAGQRADLAFERAETLLALGLVDEALRAVEAAVLAQAGDCATFTRGLQVGLDAMDRPFLRRLLAQRPVCPQQTLAVAQAAAAVGDVGLAQTLLAEAAAWPAWTREVAERRLALADARDETADPPPAWARDEAAERWRAAQLATIDGDPARARQLLAGLLTGRGPGLELRQRALQAGAVPPWQTFLRAGEELAAEPDDPALVQGAGTAWLLDQEIVLLLPGGGAVRRVHQMVRVLKDEAAESVGELRVADGADLEFARTILADGEIVLPAETADKETVSLRAVGAGAAVEYAQVVYVAPDDPASGATRLAPFLLQASDGPVRLAEYVVLVPDGVPARLAPSPLAPEPEVRQLPGYTAYVYRRTALPRFRVEPRAVRPERALPSVRVATHVDLAEALAPWHEALAAYVASRDEELDRWVEAARKLPAGPERWRQLATRLAKVVQHTHEGGPPGRPDSALQQQKGDRAAVLYTLARRLGVDACLVRVQPLARHGAAGPVDPADYGLEVVRLRLPAGPGRAPQELWYDPGVEGGLVDYLRSGLRGRPGLLAGCAAPDPRVTLPQLGEGRDSRRIQGTLAWHADGRVDGRVRDRMTGALATLVRAFLQGSNDKTREQLLRQAVGTSFAGLEVELVDLQGLGSGSDEITLEYTVRGAADPSRRDHLDLGLYPDELGQTYAPLAERRTALLFSHTLDTTVDLAVTSLGPGPRGAPAAVQVEHPLVGYARSARLDGATLHLRRTIRSRPAVVEPGDYGVLARRLRAIDAADAVRLER